jgi:hypothetical protein
MLKFKTAKIRNGKLTVSGPSKLDPGVRVKHVRFMIFQDGVMVEDEGKVSGAGWKGKTAAGGLQPGIAQGLGLAVMIKADRPCMWETFLWVEQVVLTT